MLFVPQRAALHQPTDCSIAHYLASSAPTRTSPCRSSKGCGSSFTAHSGDTLHRCAPLWLSRAKSLRLLSAGQLSATPTLIRSVTSIHGRMVKAPCNHIDALDMHARPAHHRTSGGSARSVPPPLLLREFGGAGGQECKKYAFEHNFNIRLHIPLNWRSLARKSPQGGRGVFRRTKGAERPF